MACALLLLPTSLPSAPTGPLTVKLRPREGTSVAQGRAFSFVIRAHNASPDPMPITLSVELQSPSPADATVVVVEWATTVPANGTADRDLQVTASQWFAPLGTYRLMARNGKRVAGSALSFEVLAPEASVPAFKDVTTGSGLSTVLPVDTCGDRTAAAAWGDVDGDGDLDLYVPSRGGPAQLWINDGGGHFTEEATIRGVDNAGRKGTAGVFADYDNDGDQDLYVSNFGSPNRLYRNDGSGHFTDVAQFAGVAVQSAGATAAWGDYDDDGNLDL